MNLEKEKVKHLAELARLELGEEEAAEFSRQLSEVLAYAGKVREAPVAGMEPVIHLLSLANVFREDEVEPSLPREEALANAPTGKRVFSGYQGFWKRTRDMQES